MKLDAQSTQVRVNYGIAEEKKCFECLNQHLKKYNLFLESASNYEDRVNKTDAFLFSFDDVKKESRKRCSIKIRDTKKDILVAVRDPYYGPNDEKTKIGRDIKFEYHLYVTRDPEKTKLRVASGKVIHQIIEDMWKELSERQFKIQKGSNPLLSQLHPGCELRLHYDAYSGHPKILGFIPTDYLKKGKEIVYFNYEE